MTSGDTLAHVFTFSPDDRQRAKFSSSRKRKKAKTKTPYVHRPEGMSTRWRAKAAGGIEVGEGRGMDGSSGLTHGGKVLNNEGANGHSSVQATTYEGATCAQRWGVTFGRACGLKS